MTEKKRPEMRVQHCRFYMSRDEEPGEGRITIEGLDMTGAEYVGLRTLGEALIAAIRGAYWQGVQDERDARKDEELCELEQLYERIEREYEEYMQGGVKHD